MRRTPGSIHQGRQEVYETAAFCEGATIRSAAWADQVEPLSRRQREVALLAAQGATNAEIADVLSLSVRTVESHLYAASPSSD